MKREIIHILIKSFYFDTYSRAKVLASSSLEVYGLYAKFHTCIHLPKKNVYSSHHIVKENDQKHD